MVHSIFDNPTFDSVPKIVGFRIFGLSMIITFKTIVDVPNKKFKIVEVSSIRLSNINFTNKHNFLQNFFSSKLSLKKY